MSHAVLEPPDATTSLPVVAFEFDPTARAAADRILAARPQDSFVALLRDQESQGSLLAARRVLAGFFHRLREGQLRDDPDADTADTAVIAAIAAGDASALDAHLAAVRAGLADRLPARDADPEVADAVLRHRAPLALLGGCWLDCVSQAATQPALIVNRLLTQHFKAMGQGNARRGVHHLRRRALESRDVFLPDIDSVDFPRQAHMRTLTAMHALFYLSLSRLPASFLPEVVGVQYAFGTLGMDDLLLGLPSAVDGAELSGMLAEYLELADAADRRRLGDAIRLVLALEREQVTALTELAAWQAGLSLEAKAAAIFERHAPYAGRQHGDVRVAGQPLTDALAAPHFDAAEFVRLFRTSRQLKPMRGGESRFVRAIKFGGPMFGIFDDREATVFKAWAAEVAAGNLPDVQITPNRVGDEAADRWSAAVATAQPADVVYATVNDLDDRRFFHRLVNIESFANTLPVAHRHAQETLDAAEMLFTFGAQGRYTDASWFEYDPDALVERVDRIYWDKLVNPYRPLTEIPDREDVIFGQKVFALGSLIDGTWAARIANLGRYRRVSDGMLYSIYVDEMGLGDLRKNHITLIRQVLSSMDIRLPHIRDTAFLDQAELPDHLYGFAIFQLCLAQFPDSFHNEILGYNLGIEMFGLGEMRLHEAQKLRHHGLDPAYEEAHLSIDNFSSGHARQSAEIIVAYLDEVARTVGPSVVSAEWKRIWRGYASFAYFVEHTLVRSLRANEPAELTI